MNPELRKYLESFLTTERYNGLHRVLNNRTRYLTIVLEDLYDTLNASAIIRSMDCFGLQDLHFIEKRNPFELSKKTGRGAIKWTDVQLYKNGSLDCVQSLKNSGYKIVATSPHASKLVSEIDYSQPIAFVFGNERDGISDIISNQADELVKLPMYGFAESFNISVSVALVLQEARKQIENQQCKWQIPEKEKSELYDKWLMLSVHHAEQLRKKWERGVR